MTEKDIKSSRFIVCWKANIVRRNSMQKYPPSGGYFIILYSLERLRHHLAEG